MQPLPEASVLVLHTSILWLVIPASLILFYQRIRTKSERHTRFHVLYSSVETVAVVTDHLRFLLPRAHDDNVPPNSKDPTDSLAVHISTAKTFHNFPLETTYTEPRCLDASVRHSEVMPVEVTRKPLTFVHDLPHLARLAALVKCIMAFGKAAANAARALALDSPPASLPSQLARSPTSLPSESTAPLAAAEPDLLLSGQGVPSSLPTPDCLG